MHAARGLRPSLLLVLFLCWMHWLPTVAAAALTLRSCTRLASAAPPCSQVIEGCLGILDGEGAPGDSVHLLASHRSPSPPREPASIAERLQRLPGQVRGC